MAWTKGDVWRLQRGDELLGEIIVNDGDFPWLYGRFVPCQGFADVRPLFDAELALIEADDDIDAWERAYDRIQESMSLISPDGPVTDYLLHVQGDEAWFRWVD